MRLFSLKDATTDYNNSIISLSDAYRAIKNGEDLIVVSTGLEDRFKEIYHTDDISNLRARCIIPVQHFCYQRNW